MGIKAHTTSGLTCLRGAVPVRRRRAQKASRAEASTAAAAMAACSLPMAVCWAICPIRAQRSLWHARSSAVLQACHDDLSALVEQLAQTGVGREHACAAYAATAHSGPGSGGPPTGTAHGAGQSAGGAAAASPGVGAAAGSGAATATAAVSRPRAQGQGVPLALLQAQALPWKGRSQGPCPARHPLAPRMGLLPAQQLRAAMGAPPGAASQALPTGAQPPPLAAPG